MTWQEQARCAGRTDLDGFLYADERTPGNYRESLTVALMCRPCPVRLDCLADALERRDGHGVWGGLRPRQRESLRRRHPGLSAHDLAAATST